MLAHGDSAGETAMSGNTSAASLRQLDRALAALRTMGLHTTALDAAPTAALVAAIAALDQDDADLVARALAAVPVFNDVVRECVGAVRLAERYRVIGVAFDSIRNDAATMVRQVDDGRIDTFERLANIWMKATRGDIPERFALIREEYVELAGDTQDCVEREQIVISAYRDFRASLLDAQALGLLVLQRADAALREAKTALQDAASAIDTPVNDDPAAIAQLELARELSLRALQDEGRRQLIARDLAESLTAARNATDVIAARLMQLADCVQRVQAQAATFFGTHEPVFTALSASFSGMHGLRPAVSTADPAAAQIAGAGAQRTILRAASVKSVAASVHGFQRKLLEVVGELCAWTDSSRREIDAALDDHKRRLAALSVAAAALPRAQAGS